jgi:hypothetical protein
MSLPPLWVDRIFEKLGLIYGRDFLNRWEGMPLEAVKADWAKELEGFERWPEAIAFGLKNLPPERAPTVLQFRDICRKAPAKEVQTLPPPKPDPERVRSEIAKLKSMFSGTRPA